MPRGGRNKKVRFQGWGYTLFTIIFLPILALMAAWKGGEDQDAELRQRSLKAAENSLICLVLVLGGVMLYLQFTLWQSLLFSLIGLVSYWVGGLNYAKYITVRLSQEDEEDEEQRRKRKELGI